MHERLLLWNKAKNQVFLDYVRFRLELEEGDERRREGDEEEGCALWRRFARCNV